MKDILLSILTGGILGLVFQKLGLPIPAPSVIAGVMGIVGIFLGFKLGGMF